MTKVSAVQSLCGLWVRQWTGLWACARCNRPYDRLGWIASDRGFQYVCAGCGWGRY